jgi:hypothetical protein
MLLPSTAGAGNDESVEDQGSFKILTATLDGHALRARVPKGIRFRKTRRG